jgi:hypothetical protein
MKKYSGIGHKNRREDKQLQRRRADETLKDFLEISLVYLYWVMVGETPVMTIPNPSRQTDSDAVRPTALIGRSVDNKSAVGRTD